MLRLLPAALYTAALYPLVGLTHGSGRVASFLLVLATFAAATGALTSCMAAVAPTQGGCVAGGRGRLVWV